MASTLPDRVDGRADVDLAAVSAHAHRELLTELHHAVRRVDEARDGSFGDECAEDEMRQLLDLQAFVDERAFHASLGPQRIRVGRRDAEEFFSAMERALPKARIERGGDMKGTLLLNHESS